MKATKLAAATAAALLLHPQLSPAQELSPQFDRYRPLYPAMYFAGGYAQDERDRAFDQSGHEQASATPSWGDTAFPERSEVAQFTWHFPLFESYGVPLVSTRTWMGRVTARYAQLQTTGFLADYVQAHGGSDPATEADDLTNSATGLGDTTFEFGSFFLGSENWRTRTATPYSALLLVGATVPTGIYQHEAPVTPGGNHLSFHAQLGGHWQPWRGGFVDAGVGYRVHLVNDEPQFGQLAPSKQGDDRFWDVSIAQRVVRGLYLEGFLTDRAGASNAYRNPTYAPNAPDAPPNTLLTTNRTYPTPGEYRDGGTALRTWGGSLQYFVTQRVLAGISYTLPLSGKSGEFDLPFSNRACGTGGGPGAGSCTIGENGSAHEDGLGAARSYASRRLMLTLRFNFGQGDAFTCTGCER
ncbi:MAG TPA: transporter [Candidatus Binatia bacterium]|nr:transporter [Candidatus Binatia bacterium]